MRVEKTRLLELLHTENEQIEGALPAYQRQATALQAALDDASLNGKSYDTLRERIQEMHAPRAKAQLASLKALADGNRCNADAVSSLPETSPGVADTAEAQQRIDELERMNAELQERLEAARGTDAEDVITSSGQRAMSANASIIATLRDAIAQIEAYGAASASFYQDAQNEMEGLPLMKLGMHDATQLRMAIDDNYVEQRLGVSKQDFIRMQMEQYGFDEETAETMWEVYKALYRKYPKASQEQIDWMWLRIMSQSEYNGISWHNTCGDVVGVDGTNFFEGNDDLVTQYLGIDAKAWAKLKLAIAAQHAISGKGNGENLSPEDRERLRQLHREAFGDDSTDEVFKDYMEKANDLYGDETNGGHAHADFAHQCATAATMYKDSIAGDMGFSGGADERKAYAGWMGDCVLIGNKDGGTSLGPDDYKSDLDADSISRRARSKGISYQQAAKEYYDDIVSGATNRADEFTGNHGGYDNVVSQVYSNLTNPNDIAAWWKGQVELHGEGADSLFSPFYSTDTKLGFIDRESKLRDTKNFLDALRDHQNEIPREPEQ